MKRVAVTGIGMVTALGLDTASSWDGFASGRSGVRRIEGYDPTGEKVVVAAEVPNAQAQQLAEALPPDVRDRTSRFVHFAVCAARQALAQAGQPHREAPDKWGVFSGVGFGEPLPSEGYKVGPTTIIRVMPNGAPAWIAILEQLRGPNLACSTACASGAHALGLAFDQVRTGRAVGMLGGGVDTVISRDVMRTYAWMRALNTAKDEEPTRMSRPFDNTRRGFVMGEGAAYLMLEEWEHAHARGARILAEMRGFGACSDAYNIVAVGPEGEGMTRAMNTALQDASLPPEAIDYISAHGTSTKMNDKEETHAIRVSFGKHADKLMVSSQKSMIGHAMGGAGAIEAAVTVLSLVHQTATPTINLREPDPECDLDYVPNEARKTTIRAAVSNSFGFGGHNSSMVFARPDL
ncbi:MAG: beta-ketoacyl-[acyl-carrier-protein] synthase family protein [Deltaproteobacteria bacterium]|nr:beta-ketoacyl-[acyl-carrier-protein] synthase family protein [Deltaproteobacteria bacterium]